MPNVVFFRDGPLLPTITGGAVRFMNLLQGASTEFSTYLFLTDRFSFDNSGHDFTTITMTSKEFYSVDYVFNLLQKNNITTLCFDTPESVLRLGFHLKKLNPDFRIIYDAHDVLSVLLSRLEKSSDEVAQMNIMESFICSFVDKLTCTSFVDSSHFIKLGISEEKICVVPNAGWWSLSIAGNQWR